jgi:hypothetical protein
VTTSTNPQDYITHLSGRMADEGGYQRQTWQRGQTPSRTVEQFYSLSPKARVIINPLHGPRPVMFMSDHHPDPWVMHRAHVIIAREWGDLEWPAYLARIESTYRHEARTFVTSLSEPFWAAYREAARHTSDRQRWMETLANA